jgi:hypothetical protein
MSGDKTRISRDDGSKFLKNAYPLTDSPLALIPQYVIESKV